MTEPAPRLTIGLPTYNGAGYLAQALDALLAQTYTDYELIISDNASTDATPEIARAYVKQDARVRYVRHPVNRGSAFNHNFVIHEARGEFFKWASDDDLYHPTLLARCVAALDARPEIALAHCWTAYLDGDGVVVGRVTYPLRTDNPRASTRFRSLLYEQGGDDIYGVIRMPVLHAVGDHGSYHLADRVWVAALALHGPFHQVPDHLYFRRDHPGRAERASAGLRRRCVNLDPKRADRLRHPAARLLTEYVLGYVRYIVRAPISPAEKLRCLGHLAGWLLSRLNVLRSAQLLQSPDPAVRARGARALRTRVVNRARRVLLRGANGRTSP